MNTTGGSLIDPLEEITNSQQNNGFSNDDLSILFSIGFDEGELEMIEDEIPSINLKYMIDEYIYTAQQDYNITLPKITEVMRDNKLSDIIPGTRVEKRDIASQTIYNLMNQKGGQKSGQKSDQKNDQKGGILIGDNSNNKAKFYNFIQNSTVKYFNRGANGMVFISTINKKNYDSKYTYIDPNNFGNPLKKLIIKVTIIQDFNEDDYTLEEKLFITDFDRNPEESFENEVNIQTDIFLKTMSYLQPLCPAIAYANILKDSGDKETFFDLLSSKMGEPSLKLFNHVFGKHLVEDPKYKIGIIGMEFAENYKTLYEYISDKYIEKKEKMCYIYFGLFILLKLALDTGYTQADFHSANIMINNQIGYFTNDVLYDCIGSPLIIDFGFAKKIPPNVMEKIKNLCSEKNYLQALKEICKIKRADNLIVDDPAYNNFYGWVNGTFDLLKSKNVNNIPYLNNEHFDLLFRLREEYIDTVVGRFNKLHSMDPEKYPLLPLSNTIKNQMYPGMITTGGKNKKSKKTRRHSKKSRHVTIKRK